MYHVELYLRVRLACHRDGLSQREAARRFGIDRKTVAKILKHSVPPGYQRGQAPKRPKLDPYTGIIDQILEDDKSESKKQRHTCKRIFEWLRDEHGYSGGITIVTDYVRARKRLSKEVFVPLAHDPGHAQVDFGEAWAIIAGVKRKVHYFALDLPHSDACFVKAYPAETTEAFCDGHVAAFGFFGGIPLSILYDNTTLAVAKIKKDGKRVRTETFTKLQSHYLFQDKFARPAKGNEKGKVEGLIGYVHQVVIGFGAEIIARHPRSYEKGDMVFDPMHFLPLLEQKVGALDQAAPLKGWDLGVEFATLHRLLEARMGKAGKREYVQVLRLMEDFEMADVHGAVRQALNMGAIGYDAVKHLLLCRIQKRPPRLDLDIYPYLPRASVETTKPAAYMNLLAEEAAP